ncbi:SlyX protein [Hahella sp. CCB-MM4]|uniref:SlyX family protein n=1 Tax=Hahella sp. (strain CCB-MM4) TaxID=1926491 RepID=UPI000BC84B0A|nr:SlyX family protein [Hahella sp. CCB-MM4]OZG70493.1 SlyX protein [Hahella sp. CCB-MM4]
MDQRINDLESKVAFLDDLVHSLSNTVYRQQKQIDELTQALERLSGQVKNMRPHLRDPSDEPPPPHY